MADLFVDVFILVVRLVALVIGVIAVWRMKKIGGEEARKRFRENVDQTIQSTLEAIRAHGEATRRQIAKVHEENIKVRGK